MYAVILKQKDNEYNYAVEYGYKVNVGVIGLKAASVLEAKEEAKQILQGTFIENSHLLDMNKKQKLEFAKLVKLETNLPIKDWYDEALQKETEKENEIRLEHERAEYQRLKAKFEAKGLG